ncbi:putative peptidase S10, serine carboxypeptidase, alpha/Beta hydrolase [Helianthus annuus]|nr:putative peptidase S10, serine carboxypeptidase, alpha/Beta hydrolase [Helianthus annuus]
MLGNPLTDVSGDYNSKIEFAHNMALLSDAIYESTKENCHGDYFNVDPNNTLCIHDLQVIYKCLERIKPAHILEPNCLYSNTLRSDPFRSDLTTFENTSVDILPQIQTRLCRVSLAIPEDNYIYFYAWANSRDVREALHIHEEFGDTEWVQCNNTSKFNFHKKAISYTYNIPSSVGYHRRLADKKCRALIYSGDHDMAVPYISTLNWIKSLNLSVVDGWRPWFVNKQVAGYTKKYSKGDYNLTFATVKGGGHTAPEYKHKECLSMLKMWIANDTINHDYKEMILKKSEEDLLLRSI